MFKKDGWAVKKYSIGGVIMFSRNIGARKQTKNLIKKLQNNAPVPLFVTVDEEGGDVARIAGNPDMKTTSFPSMERLEANKIRNMLKYGRDYRKRHKKTWI